jgi:PKD repeat protein
VFDIDKEEIYLPFERDEQTGAYKNNVTVNFTSEVPDICVDPVWDFGDGNTTNELNPTYVYADTGKYEVTLTSTCKTTAGGNNTPEQVKMGVYIFTVDLEVEGIPDELEETEGGQIQWNLDRDEHNMALVSGNMKIIRDFEEDHQAGFRVIEGDDEVLTAQLLVQPTDIRGTWQLIFPEQVRVFQKKSDATFTELTSTTPSSSITVPTDGIVANLRIEAVDQSKSKRDIVLKAIFTPNTLLTDSDTVKLTSIVGDLTISEIRPVQVIENVTLVKDRATVARIFVKWSSPISQLSDGAYLEDVKVKLEGIPGKSLTSLPTVAYQYQQTNYFRSNALKMEFTNYIRDLIKFNGGEAITVSKFFPDSLGTVTYQATVDPEATLFESDESNNEYMEEDINVAPFIQSPYKMLWQYLRREDDPTFVTQNLSDVVSPLYKFFISVYPIPDRNVVNSYGNYIETFESNTSLKVMFFNLFLHIREIKYDRGVYIVPAGSLGKPEGITDPDIENVVLVTETSSLNVRVAHEIGHTYGFCDEFEYTGWYDDTLRLFDNPECGFDWDEDTYPNGYVAADGWNAEQDKNTSVKYARISLNRSSPTTLENNYFSFMSRDGQWITRTNYLTLMDKLVEGGSRLRTKESLLRTSRKRVPIVAIAGFLYEDGTFEFYGMVSSTGYESRRTPGKFAIEWLNVNGQVLHRLSFNPRKRYSDYNGKKRVSIALSIKEPKNSYRLRIVKNGKELFGINRTPNAPQVKFGKIQNISEQETLVNIEVSDKDGDNCRTILIYSRNQDGPWHKLGESSGVGIKKFRFNPNAPNLPQSENAILIARTCDGLNCTNAEVPFLGIANKQPQLYLYPTEEVSDPIQEHFRKRKVVDYYLYEINAYDVEDGDIGDKVRWYNSQGALVGNGKSFTTKVKIKGLTAKVIDSNGQEVQMKVEE